MREMEEKRAERRRRMDEARMEKQAREARNEAAGKKAIDVDFQVLMEGSRMKGGKPHVPASNMRLCVCVRKRPIFQKEERDGQIDCVSVANPVIRVGEPKFKVDGITKFIENHDTKFDNAFPCSESTEQVYEVAI